MKYLIVVPDGSADRAGEGENKKTPLEIAHMPFINGLAQKGFVGMVQTIPDGIAPGSDAANLAVMGYDPCTDLTGRSPLEAVSMGINMSETDVAFRTNLVTLAANNSGEPCDCNGCSDDSCEKSGDGEEKETNGSVYDNLLIVDHSSGDISNEEAKVLIEFIDEKLGSGCPDNSGRIHFYPGVSYRHALIASKGEKTASGVGDVENEWVGYILTPPHDVLEQRVGDHLPKGEGSEFLDKLMRDSFDLLNDHPINIARREKGLNPGNSIWIWGEGKKPQLSSFKEKFGIDGSVISAVDLIKGIGLCAGLEAIDVEGATGTLDSNMLGKAEAAINEFEKGKDFVYVHVEAPDECSHQGNRAEKIEAIEKIDADVVGPLLDYLERCGEPFKILIVPDHSTPVEIRTHSSEPVPYVIYDSSIKTEREENAFNEVSGETAKNAKFVESGQKLAEIFFCGE